jgi:hypothetical protein
MGMCCCTFVGLPIGLAVGSSAACKCCILQRDPPLVVFRGVDVTMICFFAGLLLASLCALYIPLTVFCARRDGGVPWKLYPTEGECWSEGPETPPWMYLGLAAGLLMGFATIGLIISVFRGLLCGPRSSSTTHDNGDMEFTHDKV